MQPGDYFFLFFIGIFYIVVSRNIILLISHQDYFENARIGIFLFGGVSLPATIAGIIGYGFGPVCVTFIISFIISIGSLFLSNKTQQQLFGNH